MNKLSIILLIVFLAGCGEPGLRIKIDGTDNIASRLSKVTVTLVASQYDPRDESGQIDRMYAHTCVPSSRDFLPNPASADPTVDLPIVVTVRSGMSIDWECVAVRVQGFDRSDHPHEVIRVEEIYCPSDFYEDVMIEELELLGECHDRCEPEEICVSDSDTECIESPLAPLFDSIAPAVEQECWAQ